MAYHSDVLNPISREDTAALDEEAGDGEQEDGTDCIEWSGSLPVRPCQRGLLRRAKTSEEYQIYGTITA